MAKLVRALGVLLVVSGAGGVVEAGPKDRSYTIEFKVDASGKIVADKTHGEQYYEIHYTLRGSNHDQSSTTWTFSNKSGGPLFFQFKEAGACHINFVGVSTGKPCDSGVIAVADGASRTLVAEARDMPAAEYYNSNSHRRHSSAITVGREANRLDPVDPQLQIERDWGFQFQAVYVAVAAVSLAIVAFVVYRLYFARGRGARPD